MLAALLVLVGVPLASAAYLAGAEALLGRLPGVLQRRLRPWVWLAPALAFLASFLVYPSLETLLLSFRDAGGRQWAGLANYAFAVSDPDTLTAFRNSLLWLVGFTAVATSLGLLVAVLADRVRYETAVKTVVFLPMALSFVAAGVIWKFVYEFRPAGSPQIGVLNAALAAAVPHFEPRAWLTVPPENSWFLIGAGIWVWTGFCAVVLGAALKAVPQVLLEAARVEGAGEARIFWQVVLPAIAPAVSVVATTMVITALKVFDIVYVTTSGNFSTDVIANRMYTELFIARHLGRAGALAVILLLATLPWILATVRRLRGEEAAR